MRCLFVGLPQGVQQGKTERKSFEKRTVRSGWSNGETKSTLPPSFHVQKFLRALILSFNLTSASLVRKRIMSAVDYKPVVQRFSVLEKYAPLRILYDTPNFTLK